MLGKSASCWRAGLLRVTPIPLSRGLWSVLGPIMVDVMELPKARINASMLAQFIDRPVCFVGKLEKVRALAGSGERTGLPGHRGVREKLVAAAPYWYSFFFSVAETVFSSGVLVSALPAPFLYLPERNYELGSSVYCPAFWFSQT